MNKHAQALGRLNRGKKKNFSQDTLIKATQRLAEARKKRWIKKEVV